tara:strand:- start:1289 stop:1789 length:501 start_codon:yes stop_codon:yes gene_type:complete
MNPDIEQIQDDNPDNKVESRVLGGGTAEKFKIALNANKEFIKSLFFIGKEIAMCLPKFATKLGYASIELGKESLLLIKKIGNTLKVDCIPFDVLGIFAIRENLAMFGIQLPNIKLPNLNFMKNLLVFSNVDIFSPMKKILGGFDNRCLKNIKRWDEEDYVANGCPE